MATEINYLLHKIFIFAIINTFVSSHLIGDKTHLTELKRLCEHAYKCFHDTIIVCGKSVNEARTFLDLCDMYEYACEYTMVFRHVKDDDVCPNPKELGVGVGR
ncbi:uncharacterized protein LOC135081700 [Ostrinia nubilalis]|uniref:uncharacterized protein LOC135081700 n=1 Tax=Ostrinia nubilalis TaxID=29057 RepID=UPI0030824093